LRVTSGPLRRARNDDGDGNGCNDGGGHGVTVDGKACRDCRSAKGHERVGRKRGLRARVKSVMARSSLRGVGQRGVSRPVRASPHALRRAGRAAGKRS